MTDKFELDKMTELYAALIEFQGECPTIKKTAKNPFYKSKYAPFEEIMHAVRPVLVKHGLAVIFLMGEEGDIQVLNTRLIHKSGVYIEGCERIAPDKDTPQGRVAATTYAMRNGLRTILGLPTDDDDDGNMADGNDYQRNNNPPKSQQQANRENFNDAFEKGGEPPPKKAKPPEKRKVTKEEKGCWGISKRFGYMPDDFKKLLYTQHKVDSMTKINKGQWLKTYNKLYSIQLAIDEAGVTICVDKDAWVTFLIAQYSSDQPWSAIAAWMDDDDRLRELQGEFSAWKQEQAAQDEAEEKMP